MVHALGPAARFSGDQTADREGPPVGSAGGQDRGRDQTAARLARVAGGTDASIGGGDMFDRFRLKEELKRDEDNKQFPYEDTVGKLTIGVGHNLTDLGLPPQIVDALLDLDIHQAARDVHAIYPEWETLSDARQRVLLNMSFNLGRTRL